MASDAKLAANRQNAVKSSGPKTAEGKARSSANALTHGLTAKHFVAQVESVEEFEALSENVLREFAPKNELEKHKVERLIELLWKLKRARRCETAILSVSDMMQSGDYDGQYTEDLPVRCQRNLTSGEFFEIAEKAERYIERIWRQIYRLVDDLTTSRLQDEEAAARV